MSIPVTLSFEVPRQIINVDVIISEKQDNNIVL